MPRPRRSAAAKANEVISVYAQQSDREDRPPKTHIMSSRRAASRRDLDDSGVVSVKVAPNKLRQATQRGGTSRREESFEGGEIMAGRRNRGGKKNYVVDSSPDDDEEEEEDEIELDDDDEEEEDAMDVDADGDDVDAEGEEDAEGDVDMSAAPSPARPTIKVSAARTSKPAPRGQALKVVQDDDDDDDEELSDPDSDLDDQTMGLGDEDAEGDDIEEDDEEGEEDAEGEDDPEAGLGLDSADISDEEAPDLSKMTKRQRARFDDGPGEFMKLSDEVQAKKVFTAEELSMRRQEMARRRRNLSEKRNEEVKMETINKLLKKQAPKINKKAAAAAAAAEEEAENHPNPALIRWVNNSKGSVVSISSELAEGPMGKTFGGPGKGAPVKKMVEEVA